MTGKLIWCHFVEANKDLQTMLQATGEIAHDLCQGLKVDQMTQATQTKEQLYWESKHWVTGVKPLEFTGAWCSEEKVATEPLSVVSQRLEPENQ